MYVYIVECKDGTLYTGYTVDIKNRIKMHNNGSGAKYTRGRQPVNLRYVEPCFDKSTALKREKQIKKLNRKQKETLIASVCLLSL
ncbi:GIY-YIG nuclease family protein [Effusibacillus dendaii]|uniref:GIY-YIG domain-containing protein n=1 Tax=Effusibacillus dendaii TaxID=2743772 RepID=A0A7I8DHQ8_9BACL|nr:GIY-YIG nuclease family protein [Effusibacillus dendaii]BCJ88456.1 hypothetical protein skT53_34410 [Effusibacillus dendaii]